MNRSDDDVQEVVRRAQAGDEAAFADLYERYVDRVYRYVALHVGPGADAEDITEEVFLKMLQAIGGYRWRGAPFSAWLLRIAHNLTVDFWRRQKVRATTPLEEVSPGSLVADTDLEGSLVFLSDNLDLKVAMERLTQAQRQVLALRFGADLSVTETAKAMGRNEGAVKVLQYNAIRSLRRIMTGRAEK